MSQATFPSAAASGATASDALKVHVSRLVRAPQQRVFDAWTKPEQMQQWMGPAGFHVPEMQADVRAGGSYRIVYHGFTAATPTEPSQERKGACYGDYLEVVPPELLRYTQQADWAPDDSTVLTIRFREVEGGTLVEVTQETFLKPETAAVHTMGWTSSLGKLAAFLEG